jgi:DNA-binding NarL/FixJ family response regulator
MNEALRVEVVARSPLVRAGLADGLAERGDFEVVDASKGAAIDVRIVELHPGDAVPDESGPPTVLLLAGRADAAASLAMGFAALPGDAPIEAIAAAAHAAAAGLVATTPALAQGAWHAGPAGADLEPLTAREREVLRHLALGQRNREIGAALAISEHTAKFHVAQIIAKLHASSRAHAVAKALRAGLVEPG